MPASRIIECYGFHAQHLIHEVGHKDAGCRAVRDQLARLEDGYPVTVGKSEVDVVQGSQGGSTACGDQVQKFVLKAQIGVVSGFIQNQNGLSCAKTRASKILCFSPPDSDENVRSANFCAPTSTSAVSTISISRGGIRTKSALVGHAS